MATPCSSSEAILRQLRQALLPLHEGEAESLSRPAAVLILLYPRDGQLHFPLTVRPATMRRHAGQVALPGGAIEPADVDAWSAALRETEEELGVDGTRIEPVGRLPSSYVRASGYQINPFVGYAQPAPQFRPDPVEVTDVVEVPLADLLSGATVREAAREFRGAHYLVSFFDLGSLEVWGATARVLSDFARRLGLTLPPDAHWPGTVLPLR